MADKETKSVRLDRPTLDRIETFREKQNLNESDALRRLINAGLDAEEKRQHKSTIWIFDFQKLTVDFARHALVFAGLTFTVGLFQLAGLVPGLPYARFLIPAGAILAAVPLLFALVSFAVFIVATPAGERYRRNMGLIQ